MKKLLLPLMLSVSAVTLAATVLVGSKGKGAALSADGRVGGFDYSASKRTLSNGRVAFEGKLRFEQRSNEKGRWVLIEMGKPDSLGSNGIVAEFGGAGSLIVLKDGKRVSFKGRVSVRVADLKTPISLPSARDTFRIRFKGSNDLSFEFDGVVREGDLIVVSQIQP